MKAQYHCGLSVIVASGVYAVTHSMTAAVASLIAGIFIDIDHVFDFVREYGATLNSKLFFESFYTTRYKKIVLLFHGWEWIILLALVAIYQQYPALLTGITLGMLHHLIADQMTNTKNKWCYFFIYRLSKNFQTKIIIPGKGL